MRTIFKLKVILDLEYDFDLDDDDNNIKRIPNKEEFIKSCLRTNIEDGFFEILDMEVEFYE